MAGGAMKYRHLGRKSSHRQALLRNLVTSLFEKESISTTWPKAKEAQRLAEKLITLGKRNTEAARRKAMSIFYKPAELLPKLFGPLRRRYATRPGGYTRVLRIEPLKADQAPSAILELVDGPKDIRFAMTAATLAKKREAGESLNEITALNVRKVTRFREGGEAELEKMVSSIEARKGWTGSNSSGGRVTETREDMDDFAEERAGLSERAGKEDRSVNWTDQGRSPDASRSRDVRRRTKK